MPGRQRLWLLMALLAHCATPAWAQQSKDQWSEEILLQGDFFYEKMTGAIGEHLKDQAP